MKGCSGRRDVIDGPPRAERGRGGHAYIVIVYTYIGLVLAWDWIAEWRLF